ncbi:VWA domain-containing protein [Lentisphaera profundi]|uniref:VWA domain-containing protein n=1 Tax=Lentisphaera profundi TaxID=1658616 RepID=A0ABY7VS53_9BACT|nr:VWA domain-containing protein [Lentisphaera profundi]WDE95604.1 VWA domain-containing protein [Lentisphaera profundi]
MTFETPYAFFLLVLIPILALYQWRSRRRHAITFSSIENMSHAKKSWRIHLLFLLPLTLHLALISIIFTLADPLTEVTKQRQDRQGIAIQVLIDVSSSMDINMKYGEERLTRMDVAKVVVEKFIAGDDKELKGRPDDLIGLITFARYADTIAPLSLAHDALVSIVQDVTINNRPNEDGTAYGDATALAAAQLDLLEGDQKIKSKIIILLTDGENNCGNHLPLQAASLAKEWGIKIYTISIQNKPVPERKKTDKGTFFIPPSPSAGDQVLEKMAKATGGVFRLAHDYDSLTEVYKEINKLEKSKLKAVSYTDKSPAFKFFALLCIFFLFIHSLLKSTILRVSP